MVAEACTDLQIEMDWYFLPQFKCKAGGKQTIMEADEVFMDFSWINNCLVPNSHSKQCANVDGFAGKDFCFNIGCDSVFSNSSLVGNLPGPKLATSVSISMASELEEHLGPDFVARSTLPSRPTAPNGAV